MGLHLLRKKAPQILGRFRGPRGGNEGRDGGVRHFGCDAAGLQRQFPAISDVEFPIAVAATQAGAEAVEECRLRCCGIVEVGAAFETNIEFREEAGEPGGPETEVGNGTPDRAGGIGMQVFEGGDHEAEKAFVGFAFGEDLFGDFGEKIECAGGWKIG